jgi:hypothetical protein
LTCTLPTKILPQSHTPTQNTNHNTTPTHAPTTHHTHSHTTLHTQPPNTHTSIPVHQRSQNTPANTQRIYYKYQSRWSPINKLLHRCSAALHQLLQNSVLHSTTTPTIDGPAARQTV